jgi:DNA-binding HxlR family transcriptional regulator
MPTKNQVSKLDQSCLFQKGLQVVGDVWNLKILSELSVGEKRFSELNDNINGISRSILTQRLQKLIYLGLIHKREIKTMPPCSIYSLTFNINSWHKLTQAIILIGNEMHLDSSINK